MIRRWLQSRNMRRFRKQRLAIAALGAIAVYVLIGILVGVFGVITVDETQMRVGPNSLPGFFRTQLPEKRLLNSEFYLNLADRALERKRPKEALAEVKLGNLAIMPGTPDEVRAVVDRAWAIYDQLIEVDDLNEEPSLLPKLKSLESVVKELFPDPQGFSGTIRSFQLLLGTDMQGRSISLRSLYSIEVAVKIGVVVAVISVLVGSLLGAAAAFFGGWVDHLVTWVYTTLSSIPSLVLLVVLAYMFTGSVFEGTLVPMYIAFSATYWIGPCRVVRGETLKLKQLEYVQAATAIGFSRPYIMVRHILPNASHLMLINASLLFIAAIKGEVILTYLGLGIKHGTSWGMMIDQSRPEVISGFFWQIGTTTLLMFILVLAFNILSDALQDVFDPKHV